MLYIPVSIGEALDKISILEIKLDKIKDESKLSYIKKEYKLLTDAVLSKYNGNIFMSDLYRKLKKINALLWQVEDKIREADQDECCYIRDLSVMIRAFNKKRALIKDKINIEYNDEIREIKEYKGQ